MRCPRCGKSVRVRRDGQPYFHRSSDGKTCEPKAANESDELRARAEKAEAALAATLAAVNECASESWLYGDEAVRVACRRILAAADRVERS